MFARPGSSQGGYLRVPGPDSYGCVARGFGASGRRPAIEFQSTGILKDEKKRERFKYSLLVDNFRTVLPR